MLPEHMLLSTLLEIRALTNRYLAVWRGPACLDPFVVSFSDGTFGFERRWDKCVRAQIVDWSWLVCTCLAPLQDEGASVDLDWKPCFDNPEYRDSQGNGCTMWKGFNCTSMYLFDLDFCLFGFLTSRRRLFCRCRNVVGIGLLPERRRCIAPPLYAVLWAV
jgi:hypothetical protein